MPVAVGGVSSGSGNTASLSWAHVRGADGNLLLVGLCLDDGITASGVDYGATAMSLLRRDSNAGAGVTEIWYLNNITSDETITATLSAKAQNIGGAVDFSGADTAPDNAVGSTPDGASSVSDTVAGVGADDFLLDCIREPGSAPTAGPDQTAQWNIAAGGERGGGSTQDGVDGGVMSWSDGTTDWAHTACRIPVAAGLALVRAVSSTVQVSEAPSSIIGLIKSAASTVQIAEGTPRLMAMARAVASTLNISEGVPRLMAMVRSTASTLNVSEAVARPLTMVRAVASTMQISEAAASIVGLIKQVASTVQVPEAVSRRMAMVRSQSSTVQVSEGVPRRMSIARAIGSTLQVSEGTPRLMTMVRQVASTVNISEATARLGGLVRQVASTVNISEAAASIVGLIKNVPDTLQIGEATARFMVMVRAIASTVQISEGTPRLMSMIRAAASTIQIGETAPRAMSMVRSVSSTVQVSEAASRVLGLIRSVSETMQLSEGVVRLSGLIRAVNETIQVRGAVVWIWDTFTDSDGTLLTAHTPDIDRVGNGWTGVGTIEGNQARIPGGFPNRAAIDSGQTVVEVQVTMAQEDQGGVTQQVGLIARYVDASNYVFARALHLGINQLRLSNSVGFTDYAIVSYTHADGDVLKITVDASDEYKVYINDILRITFTTTDHNTGQLQGLWGWGGFMDFDDFLVEVPGSIVRLMAMVRAVSSTMQVSEASAMARSLVRSVASTVRVGESVTAARGLVRTVSDTVQVSEGIVRIRGFIKAVSDTVQITESVTRRVTSFVRVIGERFARFVRRERSARGDDEERDARGPPDERGVR